MHLKLYQKLRPIRSTSDWAFNFVVHMHKNLILTLFISVPIMAVSVCEVHPVDVASWPFDLTGFERSFRFREAQMCCARILVNSFSICFVKEDNQSWSNWRDGPISQRFSGQCDCGETKTSWAALSVQDVNLERLQARFRLPMFAIQGTPEKLKPINPPLRMSCHHSEMPKLYFCSPPNLWILSKRSENLDFITNEFTTKDLLKNAMPWRCEQHFSCMLSPYSSVPEELGGQKFPLGY